MAVKYKLFKYELEDDGVIRLRANEDYATVIGAEPTGNPTTSLLAKASKTSTEFGVRPRQLKLQRSVTEGDVTQVFTRYIPILTKARWEANATQLGQTITMDSVAWTVVARRPEDY